MPDATRARSFGAVADDYAAHRPGYPEEAVAWALAPAPGRPRVLDLAAGTGKLTASLLDRADVGEVVAVEPDPGMLARLRADLPGVDAREGTAEQIPLPDASVDAVLVGQAIHWFDEERAYPEIARVLRPGGVFAGFWNADDSEVDWVRGYIDVLMRERAAPGDPAAGDGATLDLPEPFAAVERRDFTNPVPTTSEGLIATLSTHSWALTADPELRERALGALRAYLSERPETASGAFDWPVFTLVLRTFRK
ncbi:class I SAM-dependent methyltransferase [Pseudonocardia ailaonensis]|uniref:Class I SAM-dependent methyltransferase n=1 Tax=Pseudonocardia ailaonensis TaxID=367279 RepID=A0ABN2MVC2_9PSEU